MKRGDLVEGREYGFRRSRYWTPLRVRLVAIDGEAEVPHWGRTRTRRRGIVVEILDGDNAGEARVLDNARPLIGEWADVDRDERESAVRQAAGSRIQSIRIRAERERHAAAEEAKVGRPASIESTLALIAHVLDADERRERELGELVERAEGISAREREAIREVVAERDADLAEIGVEVTS